MNISDEIKRLHDLHQAGALSAAEYEQAKAKVLASQVNLAKPSAGDDFVSEIARLRRSRSDRTLGGVCGGLARVSGVESWVWRLVFALCVIFAGFGIFIYLLMWIFVPEE
ncbi:PspC domain-containing protein [Massilia sp. TSP1-1-2]|uniref:PspC domain-containing protein n=1 Tax=unclassified Massilia TaxID=2609279 RepID=UPI003CF4BDF9